MEMRQRKREFTGTPRDFARLNRIQDSATELVKDYLDGPYKEMLKTGCSDVEVAYAFIALGYHVLRMRRPEKAAMDAFDVLAHFGKRRIEDGRKRHGADKTLKLH